MTRLRTLLPVVAAGLALTLTACDDAEGEDDATPGAASSPADAEEATDDAAAEAEESESSAEDAGSASGDCPIGSWTLSDEAAQAWFDEVTGGSASMRNVRTDITLTFTEDAFTYEAREFAFDLVAGEGPSGSATASGVVSGTWSLTDDGQLRTEVTDSSMEGTITANGVEFSLDDMGDGNIFDDAIGFTSVECSGATMSVTTPAAAGTATQVWDAA